MNASEISAPQKIEQEIRSTPARASQRSLEPRPAASPLLGKTLSPQSRTPSSKPASITSLSNADEITSMDWESLQQAAPGLLGVGSQQARWMVVGELPSEAEENQGQVFGGEEGLLLDNMLKALGLSRSGTGAQAAYLTHALKCRFPQRPPQRQDLLQHEVFLRQQVALMQPAIILALGRLAAQTLLHQSLPAVDSIPMGKLRSQVHHYQGVPVVVSYSLGYLLRNPQDKARAWADLCLAHEAAADR